MLSLAHRGTATVPAQGSVAAGSACHQSRGGWIFPWNGAWISSLSTHITGDYRLEQASKAPFLSLFFFSPHLIFIPFQFLQFQFQILERQLRDFCVRAAAKATNNSMSGQPGRTHSQATASERRISILLLLHQPSPPPLGREHPHPRLPRPALHAATWPWHSQHWNSDGVGVAGWVGVFFFSDPFSGFVCR